MIIGIAGRARSGKDTFGEYLRESLSEPGVFVTKTAFASKLKYICGDLFGLTEDQLWGNAKEHPDMRFPKDDLGVSSSLKDYWTAREILQEFGSFVRSIRPQYWIEQCVKDDEDEHYKIITDVRYPNELYAVKNVGGIIVLIERPDLPSITNMNHSSETALSDIPRTNEYFDCRIKNSGGLEHLRAAAKGTAELIKTVNNKRRVSND